MIDNRPDHRCHRRRLQHWRIHRFLPQDQSVSVFQHDAVHLLEFLTLDLSNK